MKRYFCTAAIAATMLLAGCTEVFIHIGGEGPGQSGGTPAGSDGVALVTFHAAVESRKMQTRSMSPIAQNVKAQLFAYASNGGQPGTAPVASGVYEASVAGMLSGVGGYRMYLTDGIYDFYGFSENLAYNPLPFENGKSAPLFNGLDYLWWHGTNQDVTSSQLTVPIVFMHAATQIVFEVRGGEGVKLDSLVAAHISAPEQGAQLDLLTGVIPPTESYGNPNGDKMGINGNVAQYIMLPLKTTTPMHATFTVIVNGESDSRTYAIDIPVPNGELVAGNSYRFAIVIQANGVAFDSVNVTDWVDVDETGKPLYPVQ